MNISFSQIARYITLHVISLLILIIILTKGDLTFFSVPYISKVLGVSLLLFMGITFLVSESKSLSKLKPWHYPLTITGISNLIFLPLLTLISQQERLSLWFPLLLIVCFMGLEGLLVIFKLIWDRAWKYFLQSPLPSSSSSDLIPFLTEKTVLLNGVSSALGRTWLESLSVERPKKLLLLDQDLLQLEMIKLTLSEDHPGLEIHLFSTQGLTAKTIQSILNSYKPDFIFDFNRYSCLPSAEGSLPLFLKINLLIPYWLATCAQVSQPTFIIITHPELVQKNKILDHAQKILISALQQLDTSKLRIVNIKTPVFIEDSSIAWYLHAFKKSLSKHMLLVCSKTLLSNLGALVRELMERPAYYGTLWAPLVVKKVSINKLKAILDLPFSLQRAALHQLSEIKISLNSIIPFSYIHLKASEEENFLHYDYKAYFSKLESLLSSSSSQIETFLQVTLEEEHSSLSQAFIDANKVG